MFFRTIKQNITTQIIEKKSKFIANLFYVESQTQAEEIIKEIKKKYYDARHNCFAYCIKTEDKIIKKSSDDGEPSGTAGIPMLSILEKNEIYNVLVIVTRYFGGILLGTGGLVRAYSDVTIKAIEEAEFVKEELGMEVNVEIDYSELENLKYYCKKNKIKIVNIEYEKNIKCIIEMNEQEKQEFLKNNEKKVINILNYEIISYKNIRK